MGVKLFLILMISATVCAQYYETDSYYRNLDDTRVNAIDLNDDDCKTEGLSCLDDHTLIYCQKKGARFEEIAKKDCSDTDKTFCCLNNKCSNDGCPPKIQCNVPGRFPSPFNCSLFYTCDQDLKASIGDCGCLNYNPTVEKCLNHKRDEFDFLEDFVYETCGNGGPVCRNVFQNCSDLLEMKSFPDYPEYYAYCVSLDGDFVVDKCFYGFQFSDSSSTCEWVCTGIGNFPYPSDCHKYYMCSAVGELGQRATCGIGTAFDPAYGECEPEPVAACSDWGSSSSTTETTTSTKTTTSPPTTTPDNRFHCPSRGKFVDPLDCHSYFFCPDDGYNYRHISCASGSYFNTLYSLCVFGNC